MFRAKSMTRAARLALALAAAACGGLLVAGLAAAAPAPAVVAAPSSAPASPQDRLEQLDQLHADLEVAKLRAAIAKANAEARDAGSTPLIGAVGAPPMPQLGPGNPLLNLPQIPASGAAAGKAKDKGKADSSEPPAVTLVEAWGGDAERQAILHTNAGDRLVRVGDQIALGVITGISGGAVTYRDARGRTHTID